MLTELLERVVYFFRVGMVPWGCVSLQAFVQHQDRIPDVSLDRMLYVLKKSGNYLRIADLIEEEVLPKYKARAA